MGVLGSAFARATAVVLCLALAACATAPSMKPDELERRIDAELAQVRTVDDQVQAFKTTTGNTRAGAGSLAGAYYNSAPVKLQPLEPAHATSIHQMLRQALEQRGATRFEYLGRKGEKDFAGPWTEQSFDDVPLAVQYAATLGALPAYRGAETDLRVRYKDGGALLVTIWNDDSGLIEATDGADAALPAIGAGAPQADSLRARYGIGPVDGWSPTELVSLERALSLLTPQELAKIAGLPFRRGSDAPGDLPKPPPGLLGNGNGEQCGVYRWLAGQRWIEMYDCAFTTDEFGFVGRPAQPLLPSVRMIVHEIGHAIGKKPTADLLDRTLPRYAEGKLLVEEYNRQIGRGVQPEQLHRYQQMQEKMAVISTTLNRWSAELNGGLANSSPIILQFDQVRAGTGFTTYGRWNSDEAFAEAFSLYHADPDACRRISPAAFAFFEAGRHTPATP